MQRRIHFYRWSLSELSKFLLRTLRSTTINSIFTLYPLNVHILKPFMQLHNLSSIQTIWTSIYQSFNGGNLIDHLEVLIFV